MARPLWIEFEGALYHVAARGNERKRIYFNKTDYKKFREYIDLENPLSKTYGGSILGEKFFIKQVLNKLKEGVVNRKETSHKKLLESTYQSDAIVNAVSAFFGIDNKAVLNDRREYRNICIYIMKKYTGMTNGQIGQIFNGLPFLQWRRYIIGCQRQLKKTGQWGKRWSKLFPLCPNSRADPVPFTS